MQVLKFHITILDYFADFSRFIIVISVNTLDFSSTRRVLVLWQIKCNKFIFSRGYAPYPTRGTHNVPSEPLVGPQEQMPRKPKINVNVSHK